MANKTESSFWVFGYGSLMWRPGFEAAEAVPAVVHGYHRKLCILSDHYRGTPGKPGLVVGLDQGGSCHGMALRVTKKDAAAVRAYLDKRELRGNVYTGRVLRTRLGDGRVVSALAYVVRHDNPRYAGKLATRRMVALIRAAAGTEGTARDYLANTVTHLEALGLADGGLKRLLTLVDRPATA